MKELHTLQDTAQELLGGLTAGEGLRRRVLAQAEAPEESFGQPRHKPSWWTFVPACAAVALILAISALTLGKLNLGGRQEDANPIEMISAGQPTMIPGGVLKADVPEDSLVITGEGDPAAVEPIVGVPEDVQKMMGAQNAAPEVTAEVTAQPQAGQDTHQQTGGTVAPQANLPGYNNLFVQWDGANIPLIGMQGRAYQQMQVGVPQDLVGDPMGNVSLHTAEPALADQNAWNGLLSNAVAEGGMVYMVQGVSPETAITAEVNGGYVLFQRVSFAGRGTGGQTLEQVLDVRGNVASLTLSGVGSLYDSGKANAMMSLLLENASFYADNSFQGGQSLDIVLTNGLTLQMQIADGVFTACGAWTCAEFFTQFQSMLAQ